jgi:CheY-like chemotaxis protein
MTSVLIVEDDQLLGRALTRDLTEHGFTVRVAVGLDEALGLLRTSTIDVLLTDLRLGTADGIDLLENVRALSPRTRSVLMSAFATARDYQRALELGVVRVLCKPFTSTDLLQCIRQAIDCETGFFGSIHGLSIADVLQMFNLARRSVAIEVGGQSPGRIFMRDGQFIHAEHRGRVGEPALASILAMPAGSLSTSVLPQSVEPTIERDFREILLDAIRVVDEAVADSELDELLELEEARPTPPAPAAAPAPPPAPVQLLPAASAQAVLERVRTIDGYLAACLALDDGAVIAQDGGIDLRPAAAHAATLVRANARHMRALAHDDATEDVLVTATTHYHLLRTLDSGSAAFVHVVLDRRLASPAMAKMVLASAVRAAQPASPLNHGE